MKQFEPTEQLDGDREYQHVLPNWPRVGRVLLHMLLPDLPAFCWIGHARTDPSYTEVAVLLDIVGGRGRRALFSYCQCGVLGEQQWIGLD